MQYTYLPLRLLWETELIHRLENAASTLATKLLTTDLAKAGLSEAGQHFLNNKRTSIQATLQVYTYILGLTLSALEKKPEETVLIDHGGGTGLISLLAKVAGIKHVIYNDIAADKYHDAKRLTSALNIEPEDMVLGDIDVLISHLKGHSYQCDALCSYDVLEHIYDLEEHLARYSEIPSPKLHLSLGSGANNRNPLIRKRWMREQHRAETQGNGFVAYRKVREQIIKDKLDEMKADLSAETLGQLVSATRGKHQHDTEKAVADYLQKGIMPPTLRHPTNTCNPASGSWYEHLFDPGLPLALLEKYKFSSALHCGFYGTSTSKTKDLVKEVINLGLHVMGNWGMFFAPFYVVTAVKKS